MDNLVKVLFSSINRVVFNKQDKSVKPLSSEQSKVLLKFAKGHNLAHVLGYDLKDSEVINLSEKPLYAQAFMTAVSRHEMLDYQLNRVRERFNNNQIEFIPLKGSVLKGLYPQPWLRTSTDIDILIKSEDVNKASSLLIELGFKRRGTFAYDISFVIDNSVTVELHFDFYNEKNQQEHIRLRKEMWEESTKLNGSCERVMSDRFFYYYHVEHMAKHVKYGGCGIRFFIDLFLLDNLSDKDQEGRAQLLQRANLVKFNDVCLRLASVWFADGEYDEQIKALEQYVFNGGVFGTAQTHANAQVTRRKGKFGFILSRMFLPYSFMTERYPKLKKHKWLLPYYQVHRWVCALFKGKGKGAKREIKSSFNVSKSSKRQLEAMFKELDI